MNKYIDDLWEKHARSLAGHEWLIGIGDKVTFAAAIREAMEGQRDALDPYCSHKPGCPMAEFSGGRPTPNGYEYSYGYAEKKEWYPAGKHPPCTCGLLDVLGIMDDEEGDDD